METPEMFCQFKRETLGVYCGNINPPHEWPLITGAILNGGELESKHMADFCSAL